MLSFKELHEQRSNKKSQTLVEYIINVANYKFNTTFTFIDNMKMLDESGSFTMSLFRDLSSDRALSINWTDSDEFASLSYWNDYAGSPYKADKEIIFEATTDIKQLKPVVYAAFDQLLSQHKIMLENVIVKDGSKLYEAASSPEEDAWLKDLFGNDARVELKSAQTAKPQAETDSVEAKPKRKSSKPEIPQYYANPDEVFDDLESSVTALCRGTGFNGIIVAGPGGTGKSYHVEKALLASGLKPETDWVKFKVRMTPAQIYIALLNNYDKIIVFDDCDDALQNKTAANLFKAALDTTADRYVSWYKLDTIDTTGLPNEVIQGLVQNDAKKRLPSTFIFTGAIIFITNLSVRKIDPALLTRCDVIDVTLKSDDMFKVLQRQFANVKIPVYNRATGEVIDIGTNQELKNEILQFIASPEYQAHMKKYNIPLNFRLLQRAYSFANANDKTWKRRMFNVVY